MNSKHTKELETYIVTNESLDGMILHNAEITIHANGRVDVSAKGMIDADSSIDILKNIVKALEDIKNSKHEIN